MGNERKSSPSIRRGRWLLVPLTLFVVGCGERVMPKGSGASGQLAGGQVESKENLGLDKLNELSEDQQRAADYLQQPFDRVVEKGSAEKAYDIVKSRWDTIPIVQVPEDKRYSYAARVETDAGNVTFSLASDVVPNIARSFIALAESGYFDNQPIQLVGGLPVAGPPDGESGVLLEAKYFVRPPAAGSILLLTDSKGKLSATRFGMAYQDMPNLFKKATTFGLVYASTGRATLGKIAAAVKAKPGSVTIKSIEIIKREEPLFASMSGDPTLPPLDANGLPTGAFIQEEEPKENKANESASLPKAEAKTATPTKMEPKAKTPPKAKPEVTTPPKAEPKVAAPLKPTARR